MRRSKLVFHGKSYLDSPRFTSQNLLSTFDSTPQLNTSQSVLEAVNEALSSKYLLLPSFQADKRGSTASLPHLRSNRQSVHSVPVKENRAPNRKIVSGYAKFLIEKEFIEERKKKKLEIQERIQKSLSIEDSKIMSKDIQMMVSSSIVNSASKKSRSVLKNVDTNASTRCSVDPSVYKHQAICNRILGNHFENNLLFMQIQSTLNSTPKESQVKTSSSLERIPVSKSRKSKRLELQPGSTKSLRPGTLTTVEDQQQRGGRPKVFPPGTIKIIDDARSLNEIDFQSKIYPQSRCIDSEEDLLNMISKFGKKGSEEDKGSSRVKISIKKRDIGIKTAPEVEFASSIKSFGTRSMKNLGCSGRKEEAKKEISKDNQVIEKINELCKGEKRSTSKLGNRLKKQHVKIVKQYKKLGVEVEKLNYDNTLGNWQRSIKNVDQLGEKSTFFNLIM